MPDCTLSLHPLTRVARLLCVQVASYFVDEYGFSPTCKAVAWSGDNPCAVAGMRLENPGDACISLGTSDTIFALLEDASPKVESHIFGSPVDPSGYMSLICFLNGSLVRERVREKVGAADWGVFSKVLEETPAGNNVRPPCRRPPMPPDACVSDGQRCAWAGHDRVPLRQCRDHPARPEQRGGVLRR